MKGKYEAYRVLKRYQRKNALSERSRYFKQHNPSPTNL